MHLFDIDDGDTDDFSCPIFVNVLIVVCVIAVWSDTD